MAGVADEFRLLLDERIMRGLIGGIEYGLHVFQPTQSRRPSVCFSYTASCDRSHDDVEILALKVSRDRLNNLLGDAHICAVGAPGGVWGEDYAWNRAQRIVGSERLMVEHVKRRRNVAALESGEQRA